MDAALQRLSARKAAWASASVDERLTVLKEIRGRLLDNAVPWAHASAAIRCKSGQASRRRQPAAAEAPRRTRVAGLGGPGSSPGAPPPTQDAAAYELFGNVVVTTSAMDS